MSTLYHLDKLFSRRPAETDLLLEALCNSPEWIREDIQDSIDTIKQLKSTVADNCEHVDLLHRENGNHISDIKRKEAELTRLHLKLASANAKIAGGAQ